MKDFAKKNNFPNEKGFTLENKISKRELDYFKKFINLQWQQRIKETNPAVYSLILKKGIKIENYHEISNSLKHEEIWSKSFRILPIEFVKWFEVSKFFKALKFKYGEFVISDEENLGSPNIYWRLVRPGHSKDVGPMHRDSWFWELNSDFPKPSYSFSRLKVWIPIYTEKGCNGLLVEPYSQNRNDIVWSGEDRHGIKKPLLNTVKNKLNPVLLNADVGDSVVFNDNLIHGGAINKGLKCRISVEFTMLIKEDK